MTVAVYRFARFEPEFPSPFNAPDHDSGPAVSIDIVRPAPDGVGRQELRSRISRQQSQPNDAFKALTVKHDEVGHYDAYDEPGGNGQENENVIRHYYVCPKDYFAYERNAGAGEVYVNSPDQVLKEVFRRYRATRNPPNPVFRQRVVDLRALEATLRAQEQVVTGAYTLGNVQSDTAIASLAVRGQQMATNNEVQNLKDRAESVKVIEFDLQHGDTMLRISIAEQGSVKFARTPGDAPALDVLHRLEPYIELHSQLVAVTVSQGGG